MVGLAVLSVLYFSQARDVKRLREWAGRAPERAAETAPPAVPGRAQPVPQPAGAPGAAKPGPPVPQPAGAPAAGAAKPGQPVPQPAGALQAGAAKPGQPVPAPAGAQTAAGEPQPVGAKAGNAGEAGKAEDQSSKAPAPVGAQAIDGDPAESDRDEAETDRAEAEAEETDTREGVPVGAGRGPGRAAPAVAAATGAGAAAAVQAKAAPATRPSDAPAASPSDGGKSGGPPSVPGGPGGPATPAGGRSPTAPPPVPAQQRAPVRAVLPPRPMPQQTAILPPSREPWYRRLLASPRYLVLVVAGVLILGGAAAFGISQLSNDGDSGTPAAGNSASNAQAVNAGDGGSSEEPKDKRPAVVPGNVTVAVLNGTTVPGLAKQVGDKVESHGFRLGTVANATDQDQQRAESVVLFSPGHRNEARAVGGRLQISQFQPVDPGSQELAGDATVVVIAGANLAQ